jgi:SAM-dependent methyltransferase
MTSPGSDRVESPSPRPGTRSAGCGGPASSSSRTAATSRRSSDRNSSWRRWARSWTGRAPGPNRPEATPGNFGHRRSHGTGPTPTPADEEFDIVLAAAVLHHLRADQEWRDVFAAFYRALRPGGLLWVFDLVESSIPAVGRLMRQRYGEYPTRLKDESYRDQVFAYVEKEDTPRPLLFQLDLLRQVGFAQVEVLHKNLCFAAFGAVKG